MADKEQIEIISIDQVTTVEQLRNNIKGLKSDLDGLEIGTKEYQDTLSALKVNQNALKDAMYATSSSMKDVTKAATGQSETYNSLVHRMASLKEEFRATGDAVRRAELGKQINDINDKLKEMDAMQGNFQRNVGNYQLAFKGLAEKTDVLRKSLSSASGGLNGFKDAAEGLNKSPAIATFGILVSVAMKLWEAMKDNEEVMTSLKKLTESFKPVLDGIGKVIQQLAAWIATLIGKLAGFLGSNGIFSSLTKGIAGVGNAIVDFVIAPVKAVIAAVKVFQEQGIAGIGDAARAMMAEMKSGAAFKSNYEAGQAWMDGLMKGAASKKDAVEDVGAAMGSAMGKKAADTAAEKMAQELQRALDAASSQIENVTIGDETLDIGGGGSDGKAQQDALKRSQDRRKAMAELEYDDAREKAAKLYEIQHEANEKMLDLLKEQAQAALEAGNHDAWVEAEQAAADLEFEIWRSTREREKVLDAERVKDAEAAAKARQELLKKEVSVTSSLLTAIANAYEKSAGENSKAANKVKAVRIAAATIDTISGAVGAFMQAAETIPPPAGPIIGAAEAAAVTAAGIAQIAQMRATQVGSGSSGGGAAATSVAAPSVSTSMQQVRSVTSASEEERLDQMAGDQRVYIVQSDIEASLADSRVEVAESTF